MKNLNAFALLSLSIANYLTADPLVSNDGDCGVEWVTIYTADATSSLKSPSASLVAINSANIRESNVPGNMPLSIPVSYQAPSSSPTVAVVASPSTTAAAASSSAISSAAPAAASVTPSSATSGSTSLSPGGLKAGIAGYRSITSKTDWSKFNSHISWYSDYWPDTPDSGSVEGIGMLWGDGHLGGDDSSRLSTFKTVTSASKPPAYMMGFYEPDWTPPDSSNIAASSAATTWSTTLTPLSKKGTKIGSPSMATQMDEKWLGPFENAAEHPTWDFTCIHTNKNSSQAVKDDVDYYLRTYKKPIWVSEFSCMNDLTWTACDDSTTFIKEVVSFFEGNESVVAYGYSQGDGLPDDWKLFDASTGKLTQNGQVYLTAIGI